MNQPLRSASKSEEAREGSPTKGDHDLVRRVQGGDSAAFRMLFDKYHRRAFAVAMGVVKNEDDALDAVQEAFVKVHKNIHKFEGSSSFYTWLYRIVMNVSIDHVRRTSRRRNLDFDERALHEQSEVAGDGALVPSMTDANPGKAALRRELGGAIGAALQELPDHHRAVIVLREIEGMSYEEMAETLEVPKGTIMSRLFHARKKMQAALAPYLEGEEASED
ncbi:MAG: sigma-70 family RNA polymerase sigma factor [Deltaproteobacteria bacterium]|nr:sigma-70 family RNA polymerase sigma factor [Deltaproteobacteria bacterium]